MIKKINKLLISFSVFISLLLILGCDTSVKLDPSITIGPENVTANLGDDVSLAVVFSDFETTPQTVDVYSEESTDPLFSSVAVKNNTITVSTANITTEGAYKVYVTSEKVKSNSCTVTLVATPETITISSKASVVVENDLILSVLFDNFKTNPETVDVYTEGKDEPLAKDVKVEDKSIVLSTKDYTVGAYNLYVKSGNAKSNNCALTIVAEKAADPIISISPSLSVIYGDDISCFVVFSNYETAPSKVDVYIEGKETPVFKDVAVTKNTITLPTKDLSFGTSKIYVAKDDVKSNICSLEVRKQVITLTASPKYTKGYDTYLSIYVDTENIEEQYACYEDPQYNIYVDNKLFGTKTLSSLFINTKSEAFSLKLEDLALGTHSVYATLKANESIKSNTVEIEIVDTLVKLETFEITESSDTKNTIKFNWLKNGAKYYYIYYSTSDDFSTATKATYSSSSTTWTFSPALEDGKYYFWIKTSSNYNNADGEVSDSVSYNFTRAAHAAPTGLKVETTDSNNRIKLSWNENKAYYNHVYINTVNDSSTAEYYTDVYSYNYKEITLPNAGDFYFWVRASDGSSNPPKESCTSDYSEGLKYTLETFIPVLAKPTNVSVTVSSSVSITCDAVEGASYYYIYNSLTNDISTAKYVKRTSSLPASLYYFYNDYTKGKTNYFWIRAAKSYSLYNDEVSEFSDVYEIAIP